MGTRTVANLTAVLQMNNTKFKKGLSSSQRAMKTFQKQVKAVGGMIAGAFAISAVVNFGKEAIQLAAKLEGVETAFKKLNRPDLLDDLRRATRGTVSDLELMQQAVRAKNFKVPLEQLASYFQFATQRSIETGESVDYLVNSIIDGIGRKSTLVMDNLGISATELQAEIRKTGDFGEAAGNIISRSLEESGEIADTTAIKIEALKTSFKNFQADTGGKFLSWAADQVKYWEELDFIMASNISTLKKMKALFITGDYEKITELAESIKAVSNEVESIPTKPFGDFNFELDKSVLLTLDLAGHTTKLLKAWEKENKIIREAIDLQDDLQSALTRSTLALKQQLSALAGTYQAPDFSEQTGLWDNLINTEEFIDEVIPTLDEADKKFQMLGATITGFASTMATNLGRAMNPLSEFSNTLDELAQMILDALGNIMIMAGVSLGFPAGIPLILAGLAFKMGAGFISGFGSNVTPSMTGISQGVSNSEMTFVIRGNDLVATYDKNVNLNNKL